MQRNLNTCEETIHACKETDKRDLYSCKETDKRDLYSCKETDKQELHIYEVTYEGKRLIHMQRGTTQALFACGGAYKRDLHTHKKAWERDQQKIQKLREKRPTNMHVDELCLVLEKKTIEETRIHTYM